MLSACTCKLMACAVVQLVQLVGVTGVVLGVTVKTPL
jgi:hypothetical protein